VISVDTSIAHLSGALGRKTWIVLPWTADCRWLLDRTDSLEEAVGVGLLYTNLPLLMYADDELAGIVPGLLSRLVV
jgi:hypothetical protein